MDDVTPCPVAWQKGRFPSADALPWIWTSQTPCHPTQPLIVQAHFVRHCLLRCSAAYAPWDLPVPPPCLLRARRSKSHAAAETSLLCPDPARTNNRPSDADARRGRYQHTSHGTSSQRSSFSVSRQAEKTGAALLFIVFACAVPRIKPNPDRLAKRRWALCNDGWIAGRDVDARSRVPRSSGHLIVSSVTILPAPETRQTSAHASDDPYPLPPPSMPECRGRERQTMRLGPHLDVTQPASMPFAPLLAPLSVRRPWRPSPPCCRGIGGLSRWRRRSWLAVMASPMMGRRWSRCVRSRGVAASASASTSRIPLPVVNVYRLPTS
ncbi:hypothetical protein F5X68DRAFT_60356 [Plectosphaerella plurivora]|uniref:Uncharacterized protein n=1 Tax=Plectosphaerella plurivora TaxID=936078 RepID=A0A9P9AG73_9PEZI|nr:hypothetical protein F5X68DRAFT_60356 [Plectosphaerella plurivora]